MYIYFNYFDQLLIKNKPYSLDISIIIPIKRNSKNKMYANFMSYFKKQTIYLDKSLNNNEYINFPNLKQPGKQIII